MLACTALVGCTNEDVVNNEQENQNGSNAYMAVRLVMADSYNSRAAEDGGYNEGLGAEGEPSEQKIDGTKSIFLFYDGFCVIMNYYTKSKEKRHGSPR